VNAGFYCFEKRCFQMLKNLDPQYVDKFNKNFIQTLSWFNTIKQSHGIKFWYIEVNSFAFALHPVAGVLLHSRRVYSAYSFRSFSEGRYKVVGQRIVLQIEGCRQLRSSKTRTLGKTRAFWRQRALVRSQNSRLQTFVIMCKIYINLLWGFNLL
jgi:hypothetical protein